MSIRQCSAPEHGLSITVIVVQGNMTLSVRIGEASSREDVLDATDNLLAALYGAKVRDTQADETFAGDGPDA
jgi:hypothetical protein